MSEAPLRARAAEALRRPVRRAMDGVSARVLHGIEPRLRRMEAAIRDTSITEAQDVLRDFARLLHAQRCVELRSMPRGVHTLLSAGCAGRWYFDWFEEEYGRVERHIGVELYEPRPADLPDNVEWITTSIGDMGPVEAGSVDLLFSGQNFEHLFGGDTVDFLVEAARVVHEGGHLVIDSPHREIAALNGWSHPEHTIEFTPAEAVELAGLAGFDVTALRGLWLSRDPATGALLPFGPPPLVDEDSAQELVRRIQLAGRHPEHSFVWWLEARRTAREPDRATLRRRHAEIFREAWPERVNRLRSPAGRVREEDGRRVTVAGPATTGVVLSGPIMPLAAAAYTVHYRLRRTSEAPPGAAVATLDAVTQGASERLAERTVTAAELPLGEWAEAPLRFSLDRLHFGCEFRVEALGNAAFETELSLRLDDPGSPVWPDAARDAAPSPA